MSLTFHISIPEIIFVGTMKTFILQNMLMKDLNSIYFNKFPNKQGNRTHTYLT